GLDRELQRMLAAQGDGRELVGEVLRDLPEGDRLVLEAHWPRVEPREVEQIGGELREALDLLGHRGEKLASRLLVEILVSQQLEEAAEGEDGRPELVRRIRDEGAAGVVETRELVAQALEGGGEQTELLAARIGQRLLELAGA